MSRYRLHVAKLNEFEDYCFSEGWKSEMPKSFYEVLRMKKDKKTLLVHQRIESSNGGELVHLTLHGESEIMFSKYMRAKKEMTTNTEHRRRETDRLGPYVQQVALDNANARIAELEQLLAECEDEFLSIIAFGAADKARVLVIKIDALLPPAEKQGE